MMSMTDSLNAIDNCGLSAQSGFDWDLDEERYGVLRKMAAKALFQGDHESPEHALIASAIELQISNIGDFEPSLCKGLKIRMSSFQSELDFMAMLEDGLHIHPMHLGVPRCWDDSIAETFYLSRCRTSMMPLNGYQMLSLEEIRKIAKDCAEKLEQEFMVETP